MDEVFISDEEVETYERRVDPARRSARWSFAAVCAAFALIGGAYAFGYFGGSDGVLTASLFDSEVEDGETFPLWSAGRDASESFARSSETGSPAGVTSAGTCGYESGSVPKYGAVLFSEVAWMGTEEGAQYEWIEVANVGEEMAGIGGWSVVDKDEQIQFVFPKGASIPAGSFMLLARSGDRVGNVTANFRYTGNLKNEDEGLRLFNAGCEIVDEVLAATKWPAGEVGERLTMERNLVTKAWYTSAVAGGTPKAANSTPLSAAREEVAVVGIVEEAASSSVRSDVVGAGAVVISEVMAGKDGVGNWDFVELHNQSAGTIDLTGWRMTKKSSTGNETSLVAIERFKDMKIPAGGYFLLAHPDYAGASAADIVWPKSYTLAYKNNSVVLYDADGVKVDEIVWTEIPKGQSYAEVNGMWIVGAPTPGQ